jgi:hypothetical protein
MAHSLSRRTFAAQLALAALLPAAGGASGQAAGAAPEPDWPMLLRAGNTSVTLYPVQVDTWDGAELTARCAVRATLDGEGGRAFYGVVRLKARTLTDKGQRLVTLERGEVLSLDLPAADAAAKARVLSTMASGLKSRVKTVPLDRLEAQLAFGGPRPSAAGELRHQPPAIVFSEKPAVLVLVDGEPVYRQQPGLPLQRLVNTRALILREPSQRLYLRLFDGWLTATALAGPWTSGIETPDLKAALEATRKARLVDPLTGRSTPDDAAPSLATLVPEVIVATRPTELIVTESTPRWTPIAGTRLAYVENTTGHVFRHGEGQAIHVLLAGRWFRAGSFTGPWTHVASNALPADFAAIPQDSPKENVLASVAGTPQAREAAVAATVPQTALVRISGTTLSPPVYDGTPVFQTLPGSTLQYATNTATPVLVTGAGRYYAVENAVWFESGAATGPWKVAAGVPEAVYAIPASSPLHYVTFVRLYSVEGDLAYVGYTPGYLGTYVDPATGTVVHGTGHDHAPWIGSVWHGQPITYGFGAAPAYTPWTGWSMAYGFGWSWGSAVSAAGWGWGTYPWWGALGWGWAWGPAYPWAPASAVASARKGAAAWGPGGWSAYAGNVYRQWGNRATVSRAGAGSGPWTGNAWAARVGTSYNSRTGIASAGQRGVVQDAYAGSPAATSRGAATAGASRGGAEDVYATSDGNVYRYTATGWQKHEAAGGWQAVEGMDAADAARQETASYTNPSGGAAGQLERARNARVTGASRSRAVERPVHQFQWNYEGGSLQRR